MGIQNWSDTVILVNLASEPYMGEELHTANQMACEQVESDVVVDFSDVMTVTSSSLAKLLKLRKTLHENGRKLVLCGMGSQTRGIFSLTGLDMVFHFVEDQFIALAGLQMAAR